MTVRHTRSHAITDRLPDVLQFMQLLWAVVHRLEKTSKRMATDIGVTGPQRLALRVVGLAPGLSPGALARTLHIHPSTATGILQRLAAQDLIERVEAPQDRRRATLRLTAKGGRINRLSQGTVEASISRALDGVSVADRHAAERVLARLAEHVDAPERRRIASNPAGGQISRPAARARRP